MARISWQEACQLDPSLLSLAAILPIIPSHAETLMGGLTNRCWKLTLSDTLSYIWRPHSPLTQAFTISRTQEYQVLHFLDEQRFHFAPRPVFVNANGLLVEWMDGQVLSDSDPTMLARILSEIHRLNTTKLPLVPFNFAARVDHYWLLLKQQGFDPISFEQPYLRLRHAPDSIPSPSCLCHFDLGPHNLIHSPLGTAVIDWEYAAYANPMIDLAMTISMADCDTVQLVGRYCQLRSISDVDAWIQGVNAWLPRVSMMSMLWYLVAHVMGYGEHYRERAIEIRDELCGTAR